MVLYKSWCLFFGSALAIVPFLHGSVEKEYGWFPRSCGCNLGHLSSSCPYFKKIAKNRSVKAFVKCITASVIGTLACAVILIATRTISDIYTVFIAILTMLSLIYIKKKSTGTNHHTHSGRYGFTHFSTTINSKPHYT